MKTALEFYRLLEEFGEDLCDPIEYIGYGDVKNFVAFLQKEMNIPIPSSFVDEITSGYSYGDVFYELGEEDYFLTDELYQKTKAKFGTSIEFFSLSLGLVACYFASASRAKQAELIEAIAH